jgi:hypothetical protein
MRVVAGGDQELTGDVGADPEPGHEAGGGLGDEGVEVGVKVGQFGIEVLPAAGDGPQRRGRGVGRVAAVAGLELDAVLHQGAQFQGAEIVAQDLRGGRDQAVELEGGLRTGFERGPASDPQHSDRFDQPVAALGGAGRRAGLHRSGGRLGIERVGLPAPPSSCPIRSIDFDHPIPVTSQMVSDPGPPRPGAFDPDGADRPKA